jgi:nitrite reductase/ring-hydroxylating ferredoxin subunit
MPDEVPDSEYVELTEESALWDGEMEAYDIGDGTCPHQSSSLVEGELEGSVLTCRAHEWQFDVKTGESVNPRGERLTRHDVQVGEDGTIRVRLCTRITARSG